MNNQASEMGTDGIRYVEHQRSPGKSRIFQKLVGDDGRVNLKEVDSDAGIVGLSGEVSAIYDKYTLLDADNSYSIYPALKRPRNIYSGSATDFKYKYGEGKVLAEIEKYIQDTYSGHYVGEDNIQCIDIWRSMGIAFDNYIGCIVRYTKRFGKKEGKNRKDLVKTVHYAILALADFDRTTNEQQ